MAIQTLPHPAITKIPDTKPLAIPELWNQTYRQIDANFSALYIALSEVISKPPKPDLSSCLMLSGGTMTGLLTLSANPTANLHAATKQYVDNTVAGAPFVKKTGDAMTGALTLPADPTTDLQAATKQYVDSILNKTNTWTAGNTFEAWSAFRDNLSCYKYLRIEQGGSLLIPPVLNSGEAVDKPLVNMLLNNSQAASTTAIEYLRSGSPANTFSLMKPRAPAEPEDGKYYPIDNAHGMFINCAVLADGEIHARYGWSGTELAIGLVLDNLVKGGGVGALQTPLGSGSIAERPEQYQPGAILPREKWEPFIAAKPHHLVTKQYLEANCVSYTVDSNGETRSNYVLPPNNNPARANIITSKKAENIILGGANHQITIGTQNTIINGYQCGIDHLKETAGCKEGTCVHANCYSDMILNSSYSYIGNDDAVVVQGVVINSRYVVNPDSYTIAGGVGSGGSNSSNRKFSINCSNGDIKIKGNLSPDATFTDYAEYFENKEKGILPLGSIVALDGRFVRLATADDEVLGVVSATGCVAAGDSNFCWAKRYLTGEFGERLYHDIPDPDWEAKIPDPNWAAQVPANTVTPKIPNPLYIDGEENTDIPQFIDNPDTSLVDNPAECPLIDNPVPQGLKTVPVENPDFDITQKNIPRSERPEEWTCVGLLGQVHVRADESINVGDWVKPVEGLGTKSDTKTNLRCMEIRQAYDKDKGYAVAFCLLK